MVTGMQFFLKKFYESQVEYLRIHLQNKKNKKSVNDFFIAGLYILYVNYLN